MNAARKPARRRGRRLLCLLLAACVLASILLLADWPEGGRAAVRMLPYVLSGAWERPGGDSHRVVLPVSPELVADLHAGDTNKALVVLAHGSARDGRSSALVRLLASRLNQAGHPVLSLDLRGFGESEDPDFTASGTPAFEDDFAAAARYAIRKGWAGRGGVVYAGHSLGAGVALRAARIEPRPLALVLLGAPANTERFPPDRATELRRFAEQRLDDMEMPSNRESVARMGRYLLGLDVARDLAHDGIAPALLLYGAGERIPGRWRGPAAAALPPHRLHIVANAGHNYGVRRAPFGCVCFDEPVLDDLLDAIRSWIVQISRSRNAGPAGR